MANSSASFPRPGPALSLWKRFVQWFLAPTMNTTSSDHLTERVIEARELKYSAVAVEVDSAVAQAALDATRGGHATVAAPHLLRALLDQTSVVNLLTQSGADLPRLREEITLALDDQATAPEPSDGRVKFLVHEARVMRTRVRAASLRSVDVLVDLPRSDDWTAGVFRSCQVSVLALRTVMRGVVPMDDDRVPENEPACAMVHDDEFTTQQLLMEALVDGFGLSAVSTARLAQVVFLHGRAPIVGLGFGEARSRARRAEEMARSLGFPLRITCHAAYAADAVPERISFEERGH